MTLLDVLKERLPKGAAIDSVVEREGGWTVYLTYKGGKNKTNIPATCAPGKENDTVDFAVFGTIGQILFKLGEYGAASQWYAKQQAVGKH